MDYSNFALAKRSSRVYVETLESVMGNTQYAMNKLDDVSWDMEGCRNQILGNLVEDIDSDDERLATVAAVAVSDAKMYEELVANSKRRLESLLNSIRVEIVRAREIEEQAHEMGRSASTVAITASALAE